MEALILFFMWLEYEEKLNEYLIKMLYNHLPKLSKICSIEN